MAIALIAFVILITIGFTVKHKYLLLPARDTIHLSIDKERLRDVSGNYFETQKKFDCAGYSAAYVMRELGINRHGEETYKEIKHKQPFGFIAPKSVVKYFLDNKIKAQFRTGTIESLKSGLSNGDLIIVFLKVFREKNYYHYNVLNGHSEHALYFAESLSFLQNAQNKNYNREISIDDFICLWNINIPFHSCSYIAISRIR